MSVQDVMAMTEYDGWIYSGIEPRDGMSFVCSSYVTALYKAAGLFDEGVEVQGTEFVPKDVYSLNFFDTENVPDECKSADPELNFCQLRGKYRQQLPGYNTLEQYTHMNENCTVNWPTYSR